MLTLPRDEQTVGRLQELLEAVFRARDGLYAMSDSLADEDHRFICRRLGEQLGGHAADLQQVVVASGAEPVGPADETQTRAVVATIRDWAGERGVLDAAERCEHVLTEHYDRVLNLVSDRELVGMLCGQRRETEFADRVLRKLLTGSRDLDGRSSE